MIQKGWLHGGKDTVLTLCLDENATAGQLKKITFQVVIEVIQVGVSIFHCLHACNLLRSHKCISLHVYELLQITNTWNRNIGSGLQCPFPL